MLAVLSAIVAFGCVLASARRMALAIEATSLDPKLLADAFQGMDLVSKRALRDVIAARRDLPWEHEVFAVLANPDPRARDAVLEEQLIELDWRLQRWGRVPRVCASIATSGGFLFASIALMQGLAAPAGEMPAVRATLQSALDALLLGVAGTVFCVVVHLRTRRVTRERLAATERLVASVRATSLGEVAP
jgi:hypothetical protein